MSQLFSNLNAWVRDLASTNFKIAVGAWLACMTAIFYFGSEMRCSFHPEPCRPIDSTNFGLWLTFVAAWAGISYLQFSKKRDTYASPSPDSERANVPADPPPSAPSPSPAASAAPEPVAVAAAAASAQPVPTLQSATAIGAAVPGEGD